MGHNMYSSVAKCLAEFVANSYDADARNVYITMDFNAIDEAKAAVRKKAREEKSKGLRDDTSAIYDPLPFNVTIEIRDDGHGMSAREIQDYYMAITRNRREDETGKLTKTHTESGERRVMGRKGVGKLAGFGAAEHIKVTSKRGNQSYSTTFEMDYGSIKGEKDLTEPKFEAVYDEINNDEQYTIVTLSQLRCDSMKSSEKTITDTLSRTFSILDKNFKVFLNKEEVEEEEIDWEFTYPVDTTYDKMASETVIIDEDEPDNNYDIKYIVRFRARPNDHGATEEERKRRRSLPASRRGARIYTHGRLAHGPSLLNLHSGVHNFHAQDYMECIVIADAIDEFRHDCIVTSREGLHSDNPIVGALFSKVTGIMKEALYEQYKFRDVEIETAIDNDPFSQGIVSNLQAMNKESQKAAKQILKVIGKEHGIQSDTYREMAPILLHAVNAGDVITKLIALETDPKSLPVLAHSMAELARIENNDLLKLYRARSKAISGLQKLHEDSLDVRKGEGYENELHSLFKEFPWLINPLFGSYITSDKPMGDVCRTLNQHLDIDRDISSEEIEKAKKNEDHTRPDLVFMLADQATPDRITIVELKSPGIELNNNHLTQLEEYMFKTEEYLASKLGKNIDVQGYLIGTKPKADSTATAKRHLLSKIAAITPNTKYKIIDILELISTAKQIHQQGIELFEVEEKRMEEELS